MFYEDGQKDIPSIEQIPDALMEPFFRQKPYTVYR